jgi:hypothetical protein
MTPEDEAPDVWLNDAPLTCQRSWRKRLCWGAAVIGFGEEKSPNTAAIGWGSATDIEILAGEPIVESDRPRVMEILSKPIWRRGQITGPRVPDADKLDMDIFMLVEADVSAIPPDALRQGLNRIWIKSGARREGWITEPFMGELEIVTER